MLAPVTHLLALTTIRRDRLLPTRGRVLVRAGQKVNATDVIAESVQPGEHLLIDVRRALGIERVSTAQRIIERTVGERLEKGDIIAQTGGLFSRVIRAPEDCEVVAIQRGQVLLELNKNVVALRAGINGTIVNVLPEMGATVETNGALLQGVWGNGPVDMGLLQVIAHSPEEELTRPQLDMTMRGAVVVGGHVADADTLQAAGELPVRGLVLASMTADLLPIARQMTYPILLLEGFGRIAINPVAFKLLLSNVKRDAAINANWNPDRGERPELVIPLPADAQLASDNLEFKPGQIVKILKPPYTSQIGVLTQVRPGLTLLPNGLRAPVGQVRLETNEQVTVPLANLTLIE